MLVAHSYGGAVISNVAADAGEIIGLVYVNGFAPEPGESCFTLASLFPGSTLAEALQPIPRSDGTTDLLHRPRPLPRPVLPRRTGCSWRSGWRPHSGRSRWRRSTEPSGESPLWRELPSWFLIGEEDKNIPAALQRFMAERAGARRAVEIPVASHAIPVSQPQATRDLILQAASAALRMAA